MISRIRWLTFSQEFTNYIRQDLINLNQVVIRPHEVNHLLWKTQVGEGISI